MENDLAGGTGGILSASGFLARLVGGRGRNHPHFHNLVRPFLLLHPPLAYRRLVMVSDRSSPRVRDHPGWFPCDG